MTINSFKTIGFSILGGAAGGTISGVLVVLVWMLGVIIGEGSSFPSRELLSIPFFSIFGAIYGLVGGSAAGLIGGVLVLTLFSAEKAPLVGRWFGLLIGAAVAGIFSQTIGSGALRLLVMCLMIIGGAAAGAFGGSTAGKIMNKLNGSILYTKL